jgi:hypothetical protein
MKKVIKILGFAVSGIIIALALVIGIWYAIYTPPHEYGKKYFDLFIVDILFRHNPKEIIEINIDDEINSSCETTMPSSRISWESSIRLNWEIPVGQFGNDIINISFTNTSGKKLYYLGYLSPTSCCFVFYDYIITPQGSNDTIILDGKLDFLDVSEYVPLRRREKKSAEFDNPLRFYPEFRCHLPTDTEEFPHIIKEVYGDTVQIRFGICLIEPWKYPGFSMSFSDFVKIPVQSVIEGWEKGNFTKIKYDPESHQEYFESREELRALRIYLDYE